MRTIFAEIQSTQETVLMFITSAGYMLRIDCWEAEKNLKNHSRIKTVDINFTCS